MDWMSRWREHRACLEQRASSTSSKQLRPFMLRQRVEDSPSGRRLLRVDHGISHDGKRTCFVGPSEGAVSVKIFRCNRWKQRANREAVTSRYIVNRAAWDNFYLYCSLLCSGTVTPSPAQGSDGTPGQDG